MFPLETGSTSNLVSVYSHLGAAVYQLGSSPGRTGPTASPVTGPSELYQLAACPQLSAPPRSPTNMTEAPSNSGSVCKLPNGTPAATTTSPKPLPSTSAIATLLITDVSSRPVP